MLTLRSGVSLIRLGNYLTAEIVSADGVVDHGTFVVLGKLVDIDLIVDLGYGFTRCSVRICVSGISVTVLIRNNDHGFSVIALYNTVCRSACVGHGRNKDGRLFASGKKKDAQSTDNDDNKNQKSETNPLYDFFHICFLRIY